MTHPEIADKILTALLAKKGNSPSQIAQFLALEKAVVQTVMEELKSNHKTWFEETTSNRQDHFSIMIKPTYEYIVRAFLENKGFTGLENKRIVEVVKQENVAELKESNLQAASLQSEQSMPDSKEALQFARLANEIAQKSEQTSRESIAIANEANEIARRSKKNVIWAAILAAIISSLLTWCLTKL